MLNRNASTEYKIDMASFNLVASAIENCFSAIKRRISTTETYRAAQYRILNTKKTRRKFADSPLVKMWCDCSDNFEHSKLRKKILEHNK